MTSKELIELLKKLDPDGNMKVVLDDGWDDTFTSIYIERDCIQLGYNPDGN